MPEFAYIARDPGGQKVEGVVSALSERDAVSLLAGRELFPLKVSAPEMPQGRLPRRIRSQAVATFYGQLAALLRSGVPLLRALDVLRRQTTQPALAALLRDVHDQVEQGATLADALSRHERVFSPMACSIVRAGGEGGFLEEALDHVAQYTDRQQELKSRTAAALFYPLVLVVVGSLVVSVLVIFFVPKFEPLFARLRELGELPALTSGLLAVSRVLQTIWPLLLVAAIAGVLVVRARLRTPSGRRTWDAWKLRLPLAGGLLVQLAVGRFCRVLGTLLRSGVPIVRSLSISSHATGNVVLAEAIQAAAENISAGQSLAGPLAACGHFPADVVEIIAVAEESNTLDQALLDTAASLERHTWRRLELLVRLIEPVLLMLLAAVVLVVVVALILPMLKMSMTV